MFAHLPIVMLATLSPVAVSDTVPRFDIAKECRFEGGADVEYARCSQDEGAALQKLQSTWTQFSGADKKICIASTTIGGFASYVDLQICLELARDVNDENDSSHGWQPRDAMRSHALGETVGIGQGPITSQQAPARGSP